LATYTDVAELDFPAGRGFGTEHAAGDELRCHRGGDYATEEFAAIGLGFDFHGRNSELQLLAEEFKAAVLTWR
jgi:hypothetical protein